MKFKEFVSSINTQEMLDFWDSIIEVPQEAIDRNWKYSFNKDGKLVPVKWFVKELAKSKNIHFDFNSNYVNRDFFAEKFGFKIHEDLVFDQQDLKRFRTFYENYVDNKSLFQFFIDIAHRAISQIGIDPYRVRVAISHENEPLLIVGMRAVLAFRRNKIGFIVNSKNVEELKDLYHLVHSFDFKGNDHKSFYYSQPNFLPDSSMEKLLKHNFDIIEEEYKKVFNKKISRWNSEANSTSQTLHKILFEGDNVEEFLNIKTDMETIDLQGKKLFKLSMGSFLKDRNYDHIDPIELF